MIGNKIAHKITSLGKTKSDGKENGKEKGKEEQDIYIPPEKRPQIIEDLRIIDDLDFFHFKNNTLIDNEEDLDIVMPMYNWLDYSKNYSKTIGSFWNYYRDEPNSGLRGSNNNVNYSIKDSKSFDYKTSITGKLEGNNAEKEVKIVVQLKSYENKEDRTSFLKYYVPKVEIKDFNVLIDEKRFFDVPVRNKEEGYEKIMSISKNNDYTTSNSLDYEYFSKHYKLIAIDLSKQIELENPDLRQQINFIGKLSKKQQCFSLLRNQKKRLLNFYKIL